MARKGSRAVALARNNFGFAYNQIMQERGSRAICLNPLKAKVDSMFSLSRQATFWARRLVPWLILALYATVSAHAESCQTASDMDEASRFALTTAGQRFFDMIARGDTAGLRQNATASLAGDFSGIEGTVKDHQAALAGSHAMARPPFLLEATGSAPIPHAEFFCGVFGKNGQTANSAVFYLNDLPPGKYGVVILDASGKTPTAVSLILQQVGSDWKLGGLHIKSLQLAGHDSQWFAARAREYMAKGQMHNAWLYFLEARNLISPLPFMSTLATDNLYDESQKARTADLPGDGKTVDLTAGTTTYKLTDIYPEAVGNDLDLIVRYQMSDISNTNLTYQSNMAVIKAIAAKYPEIREAFAAVVARAVAPGGRDYGTLLAMKDIK